MTVPCPSCSVHRPTNVDSYAKRSYLQYSVGVVTHTINGLLGSVDDGINWGSFILIINYIRIIECTLC